MKTHFSILLQMESYSENPFLYKYHVGYCICFLLHLILWSEFLFKVIDTSLISLHKCRLPVFPARFVDDYFSFPTCYLASAQQYLCAIIFEYKFWLHPSTCLIFLPVSYGFCYHECDTYLEI